MKFFHKIAAVRETLRENKWDFVKFLSILWFPFGLTLLTLSVIIVGPLMVVLGYLGISDRAMGYLVRLWAIPVPCYFFIRYKVIYPPQFEQSYDPKKPCLVVSNHQSLLDIPAAYWALKGEIRMIAKASLFSIPIFGQACKAVGHVKIVRGDRSSGRSAILGLQKRLQKGLQMWVAPEGTRSLGWKMGPFKTGGLAVALDMELDVQPLVVLNAFQVLGKKQLFPRIGSCIYVQVLPLVSPQKMGLTDKTALSQYLWEQMDKALSSAWASPEALSAAKSLPSKPQNT